jgi:hypothetical protein
MQLRSATQLASFAHAFVSLQHIPLMHMVQASSIASGAQLPPGGPPPPPDPVVVVVPEPVVPPAAVDVVDVVEPPPLPPPPSTSDPLELLEELQ